MSLKADIKNTLSTDWIKSILTIEDRAKLLTELFEDLEYDDFDLVDENDEYIGRDVKSAIEDLKIYDKM